MQYVTSTITSNLMHLSEDKDTIGQSLASSLSMNHILFVKSTRP